MNPFEIPPSGAPVSFEAPAPQGRGRGRMALVAVVTAGLMGGGVVVASQFASADRADLASTAPDEPTDDPTDDTMSSPDDGDLPPAPAEPTATDGQIVLDNGDGDPIVIELGDYDEGDVKRLTECIGFPMFDFGEFDPGTLPHFDDFLRDVPFDLDELDDLDGRLGGVIGADGGTVTVSGPDGLSVVDLGENGSVTVTKDNGEITVETSGDASLTELSDLFGEFGSIFDIEPGTFDDRAFDEFLESLPAPGGLSEIEPIDPEAVQACIDEVLGN